MLRDAGKNLLGTTSPACAADIISATSGYTLELNRKQFFLYFDSRVQRMLNSLKADFSLGLAGVKKLAEGTVAPENHKELCSYILALKYTVYEVETSRRLSKPSLQETSSNEQLLWDLVKKHIKANALKCFDGKNKVTSIDALAGVSALKLKKYLTTLFYEEIRNVFLSSYKARPTISIVKEFAEAPKKKRGRPRKEPLIQVTEIYPEEKSQPDGSGGLIVSGRLEQIFRIIKENGQTASGIKN